MQKYSNEGLKREVKFEVPPPGLTYGGAEQRFFNQSPKDLPPQTKPLEGDADSMMTDVNTTQNQKQTETPTNFAKREPIENRAQQLPNTDPEAMGENNWPKQ